MLIEKTLDLGNDIFDKSTKFNGFLGVSIMHRFFSKKNMKYYFDWASNTFNNFVILLMDDPDKYNFQVFKKMTESESISHAHWISDNLKIGYQKQLNAMKIENIKIVQFRDFVNNAKYIDILENIYYFMQKDEKLKIDLYELMEMGIGGKIIELDKLGEDINYSKKILVKHIIEELASIIFFTENGYPIEVDPTIEFITKTKIYEGEFVELYNKLNLSRRGHIFAHPEGITKNTY